MPSSKAIECFHHLITDSDFNKEFRDFVRDIYRQGRQSEYGLPQKWESFVRQQNRIRAFVEGSGKQSRSGQRMWDRGMNKLVRDFFDSVSIIAGRECLRDVYGIEGGQDKMVGMFGDILSHEEYEELYRRLGGRIELRGPFSDYLSLRNYLGMLTASAPLILGVVCGQFVLVMGSNPEQ